MGLSTSEIWENVQAKLYIIIYNSNLELTHYAFFFLINMLQCVSSEVAVIFQNIPEVPLPLKYAVAWGNQNMQTGKRIQAAIPDQNLRPPQFSRTSGVKPEEISHRPQAREKLSLQHHINHRHHLPPLPGQALGQ